MCCSQNQRLRLLGKWPQTRGLSVGKNKNTKGNKREQKHCSQTKNRLNLQESQLKLNCESGITLYIKKENNLALSPLVVFSLCF